MAKARLVVVFLLVLSISAACSGVQEQATAVETVETVETVNMARAVFQPQAGTVEMWVNSTWNAGGGADWQHVLYWGSTMWHNELRFWFFESRLLSARWIANGEVQVINVEIPEWKRGEWRHIAVTWDATQSTSALFLDGEQVAVSDDWKPPQGEAQFHIGSDPDGGHPFGGRLAGVNLWDHPRTEAQIAAAFAAGFENAIPWSPELLIEPEPEQEVVWEPVDMIMALAERDPSVALEAIGLLRREFSGLPFGGRRVIFENLLQILSDPQLLSATIESMAKYTVTDLYLASINDTALTPEPLGYIEEIQAALDDEREPVRAAATQAVVNLLVAANGVTYAPQVAEEVNSILAPSISVLVPQLTGADQRTAFGVLQALARLEYDSPALRQQLLQLLQSEERQLRWTALTHLLELGLGDDEKADILLQAMGEADSVTRRIAADAASQLDEVPSALVDQLLDLLNNDNELTVRRAAYRALSGLQGVANVAPALATVGAPVSSTVPQGFLQADGIGLTRDGEPFFEISFNKFDMLNQLRGDRMPWIFRNVAAQGSHGRSDVVAALEGLADLGVSVIRVMGSAFWPVQHRDSYVDLANRERNYQAMDDFFDLCDEHGITVVFSLGWTMMAFTDTTGDSLNTFVTNPDSASRQLLHEWIDDVITRYRDRPTIAMWEIGNEHNLYADIQREEGMLAAPNRLIPAGAYRGPDNNYSAIELAEFFRQVAERIRYLDPYRLITTGVAAPRPAAMNLLRANLQGRSVDWSRDSYADQLAFLRLTTPDPVSLVRIHLYRGDLEDLADFKAMADEIGKPFMIGETGYPAPAGHSSTYQTPEAVAHAQKMIDAVLELEIPLTLYWTYRGDTSSIDSQGWDIREGKTDEFLDLVRQGNARFERK